MKTLFDKLKPEHRDYITANNTEVASLLKSKIYVMNLTINEALFILISLDGFFTLNDLFNIFEK